MMATISLMSESWRSLKHQPSCAIVPVLRMWIHVCLSPHSVHVSFVLFFHAARFALWSKESTAMLRADFTCSSTILSTAFAHTWAPSGSVHHDICPWRKGEWLLESIIHNFTWCLQSVISLFILESVIEQHLGLPELCIVSSQLTETAWKSLWMRWKLSLVQSD